jgi:hypothetical protein
MFAVGEECVFDMDCKFEGAYCDENVCAFKAQRDEKLLSSTGELTRLLSLTLS